MTFKSKVISATLLAASVAYVLQYLLSVPEGVPQVYCEEFPSLCEDEIRQGEPRRSGESFPIGRWKEAEKSLSKLKAHKSRTERFFQLKTWSYLSVTSEKYHLAITPVQFNYVEDLYLSVVDKKSGDLVFDYHWQMPFGRALKMAPTSVDACTRFDGWGNEKLSLCFVGDTWHFSIDLPGLKARIKVLKGNEALILWYPLGASAVRPAYVHKEAGMQASGSIHVLGEPEYSFQEGGANIDWTQTFALRETKWKWVSWACSRCLVKSQTSDGTVETSTSQVGINLSKDVYDVHSNKGGNLTWSAENALWIDHKVFALNVDVQVVMPADGPTNGPWHIYADVPGKYFIDVKFHPHGVREDHTGSKLVGIVSDFVQPYGAFSGTVSLLTAQGKNVTVIVDGAYGVCENHLAVW